MAETQTQLNAIERYVQAEDDSYKWEIHSVIEGEKVRHVVIDMVSQQWLTDEDIDQTEWRHWLVLTIPDGVTSEIGLMYIGGGSNLNTDPQPNPITTQIAMLTNTVVAEIGMIPNQ
ncbi:MAG: PhoPQ-activated protein PqaA family protein, partial [Gammaproteobacteria bacterium]|nr:PhoPQ-activated protein PqaA family protein [Gammaproteobacteria bacterium]